MSEAKDKTTCLHLNSRLQETPSYSNGHQAHFYCPDCRGLLPAWEVLQHALPALHRAHNRCEDLERRDAARLAAQDALTARLDALEAKQWTAAEAADTYIDHG